MPHGRSNIFKADEVRKTPSTNCPMAVIHKVVWLVTDIGNLSQPSIAHMAKNVILHQSVSSKYNPLKTSLLNIYFLGADVTNAR
jgi:hypothetical protein